MERSKPILFSAPMVRAILSDAKTQTRRVVKPQPPHGCSYAINGAESAAVCAAVLPTGEPVFVPPTPRSKSHLLPCPYGAPGDTLWARESAFIAPPDFGDADLCSRIDGAGRPRTVGYAASMDADAVRCARDYGVRLTPSIHMPRWASRITLRVTSVRVERLHAITDADALAEGVATTVPAEAVGRMKLPGYPRVLFEMLWREINGDASWDANPWVWRVEFYRRDGEA